MIKYSFNKMGEEAVRLLRFSKIVGIHDYILFYNVLMMNIMDILCKVINQLYCALFIELNL